MPSLEQDVDVIEAAATARTYTVVAGDTLTRIAARTGVSVSDLVAINQLADPDRIEVGQILRLDAATPPAPSDGTSAAARLHWGDPIREWSDEFDYTGRPDPDKWKLPPAEGWPGHAGHGHRRPENVTVADGMMILVAKPNGDAPWVMSKFDTRFMRVEVRSRSTNTGTSGPTYHVLHLVWPSRDGWPGGGEYDLMEYSDPDTRRPGGFLHYPHDSGIPVQQEQWKKDGIDVTEWHNWAFEWTAGGLKVWVDGVEVFSKSGGAKSVGDGRRKDIQDMPKGRLTHQLDMFKPNGTTMRAAKMEIDWVRFYDVP